ncbi:hypothetical protein SESBI_23854 [Sesbania bispinosa]|nr:hypothetical protein SESBI_23854 [Sesbania bispinosa]
MAELDSTQEALKNERHFKAVADKNNTTLQKIVLNLEKALKELEYTKLKLKQAKSDLEGWNTKYENIVTKLGPESYANTVEQLRVLNPGLIVFGSDPYAYVRDGVIVEDSINGPIPFVPKVEGVGDSEQAPNPDSKLEQNVENPTPLGTLQLPAIGVKKRFQRTTP